jgi:pyridoxine 5-phosphate synthase
VFLNPDPEQVRAASDTGTDRIELYTEAYASAFATGDHSSVKPYVKAAEAAALCGLGVNAGHDLDRQNLRFFCQEVPGVLEVSIGHALISDALWLGMENTINLYKRELRDI